VIREIVVQTDYEIPPLPKPRDRYVVQSAPRPNGPGLWNSATVRIFRRSGAAGSLEPVCEFVRNYALLGTFEPFRQGGREFALISREYTATAVLDLSSGQVIAEEAPAGAGFCPVGFYVPDWWDVHNGLTIPGHPDWNGNEEWPNGSFGFVWGCIWGDDSSWKVQYLDLSRIERGVITRDERFGYVELATTKSWSPCFDPAWCPAADKKQSIPPPFISIRRYGEATHLNFAVEMGFDLENGQCRDWKRVTDPFA
jgi:hypothetical protein